MFAVTGNRKTSGTRSRRALLLVGVLALPQKTRLDSYEVWVKYNMRMLGPDGAYIADWVLTSYGKTPMEGLLSVEGGINEATVSALRDLASNFALSFGAVPEVRDWLASRQNVVSNQ